MHNIILERFVFKHYIAINNFYVIDKNVNFSK